MFNPKSLVDAYALARIQEECVLNSKRITRPAWNSNQFHHSSHGMNAELPVGFAKGNGFISNRGSMQSQFRQNPLPQFGAGQTRKGSNSPNQALVPVRKITPA